MATWTCPDCRRIFGAVGRNHMCSPGLTDDEFLAASPERVAPVFRAVAAHLRGIDDEVGGDLIVDPLQSKVLFKNGPTFCVLDVKTKWVAIGFSLRRPLETGRLSRKTSEYGDKFHHVVNISDPDEIDDELLGWLTEAYHDGSSVKPGSSDPMVPDDIDFEIAPPR